MADVDALYLQTQLDAARDFIAKLEAEKCQIAEEHKRVKQVLLRLSVSSQSSAAVVR
jgi:dsRNA-specific ribonuclease